MFIILLLIFQLSLLVKRAKLNTKVIALIFLGLIWNVGWLVIFQLELISKGSLTYGSDEAVYYSTVLFALDSSNWFSYISQDFNFGYILYEYFILKTSLTDSVIWIRVANLLLLINSTLLVYIIGKERFSIKQGILNFSIAFILFNGIITWTAIRNLKDIMFIYMLVIFVFLLLSLLNKKGPKVLKIILLIIVAYFIQDIRQWFIYLIVVILLTLLIYNLFKKKQYILGTILSCSIIISSLSFINKGLNTLVLYTNTYSKTQANDLGGDAITTVLSGNIWSLPISMFRFILGPGPIRGLFGNDAFVATSQSGNILIFLGGLIWWFFIPILLMALLSLKTIKNNLIFFIILMFYWVVYSYAYAGSGDTRLRAVFYILSILFTLPYLNGDITRKRIRLYFSLLIPLICIGLFMSYRSLV